MPRIPVKRSRPRCDSTLDHKLPPDQQDYLASQLDNGMSFPEAIVWLREKHGIKLTHTPIWQWAERRRRIKSDATFSNLLETIRADHEKAVELGRQIGTVYEMNEANVLMLSQALFESLRNHDPRGTAQSAKLFATVLSAVTGSRRAEISAFTANTGQQRADADVAALAVKHSAALQAIHNDDDLTHHEKVARAVECLFGKRPSAFEWPPPVPLALDPARA